MAMKIDNVKATLLAAVFAGMATSIAGCNADTATSPDFFPSSEVSAEKKMMESQAAVGARADASLFAKHFDGNAINSLGQAKLDLITSNLPDEGPVTVYLDLPKDAPETKARTEAVTEYLKHSHLTADQFTLVNGTNPNLSTSTADALTNITKTDTGTGGGGAAGGAAGGGASGAAAK